MRRSRWTKPTPMEQAADRIRFLVVTLFYIALIFGALWWAAGRIVG